MSLALTDATGSGADIVRVKIQKAMSAGPAPGRPRPGRAPSGDRPMHASQEGLS
jgi:hypothetical protein